MPLVFVYGTLQRGGRGHVLCGLHTQSTLGPAVAHALDLFLVPGVGFNFPAAIRGKGTVSGELYVVDEPTLARMAQFETALYAPEFVEVTTADGRFTYVAATFLWAREIDGLLPAGMDAEGRYVFPVSTE